MVHTSNEVTYGLQEGRKRGRVRLSFRTHPTRSHTVCRRGENESGSDCHYVGIEQNYLPSAGGARTRQSEIVIFHTSNEITYALQEGRKRGESQIVIPHASNKITYTLYRSNEDTAESGRRVSQYDVL